MSRSGYIEDYCDDPWQSIRWRGAVMSAIKGARGQAFLKEMLDALDAMPVKRLIAHNLQAAGEVCAIGAVGVRRGLDMSTIDPEDRDTVAHAFGVARALVQEIAYMNDEVPTWGEETPEQRFASMRRWIVSQIKT